MLIQSIIDYFKDSPHSFESCAAELAKTVDSRFETTHITRKSADGSRDAVGQYNIGLGDNNVRIQYSLEAKCYSLSNSLGVTETSRLISRLRYRHFGVIITTSHVGLQAYKEIVEDGHPVLILAATDIVSILRTAGLSTPSAVKRWLKDRFPLV